ncbi:MAG: TlpA disulfide reductase family protein [Actinomycetota bacterium]|nr:TlpA disulfide reductase family protein [Actinomycetota bacterium]
MTVYAQGDRVDLPPLAGRTLSGGNLAIADLRGQVVVLNNWASWCEPCNEEAEALVEASKKFASQNVQFVGLDVTDQDAAAQDYTKTHGVEYPSIVDPKGVLLASVPSVPPGALPSTLIIDPQGRIAVRIIGVVKEPVFSEQITSVLAEE